MNLINVENCSAKALAFVKADRAGIRIIDIRPIRCHSNVQAFVNLPPMAPELLCSIPGPQLKYGTPRQTSGAVLQLFL